MQTNDHAFIYFSIRMDKELASVLQVKQAKTECFAANHRHEDAPRPRSELDVFVFIVMTKYVSHQARARGERQKL